VITPNPDELASLLDRERDEAAANPDRCAGEAAMRYEATIVAKGEATVIAAPGGAVLRYPGGGVGLATGGSGDVLAGIIAALLARGADPLVAAGWGVWLHGEAGRRLAAEVGPVGFLARELAPRLPRLMHELAR
jgi:ADP-dependent NAD(P)H-hydrate dehydratase